MQTTQQNPSFYAGQQQFQPQFNATGAGIPTQSFNNPAKPALKTAGAFQQAPPQQRMFDGANEQMMMNPQQQQYNNNSQPAPVAQQNSMNMDQFSLEKQNDGSLDLISGEFDFSSIDVPDPTPNNMGMDEAAYKTPGFDEMSTYANYQQQPMMAMQGQAAGPGGMKQANNQMFAQDPSFNDQQYQMPVQQQHHQQQDFAMSQQQPGRYNQYAQPANQHNSNANNGSSLKLLLD